MQEKMRRTDRLFAEAELRFREVLNTERRCSRTLQSREDIIGPLEMLRSGIVSTMREGRQCMISVVNGAADLANLHASPVRAIKKQGAVWEGFTHDLDTDAFMSKPGFECIFPRESITAGQVPDHFRRAGFIGTELHAGIVFLSMPKAVVDVGRMDRYFGMQQNTLRALGTMLDQPRDGITSVAIPPEICVVNDFKDMMKDPDNYRTKLRAIRGTMMIFILYGGVKQANDALLDFQLNNRGRMEERFMKEFDVVRRHLAEMVDATLKSAYVRESGLYGWLIEQGLMFTRRQTPRGKELLKELLLRVPIPQEVNALVRDDATLSQRVREMALDSLIRH